MPSRLFGGPVRALSDDDLPCVSLSIAVLDVSRHHSAPPAGSRQMGNRSERRFCASRPRRGGRIRGDQAVKVDGRQAASGAPSETRSASFMPRLARSGVPVLPECARSSCTASADSRTARTLALVTRMCSGSRTRKVGQAGVSVKPQAKYRSIASATRSTI